jgi:hypothetical protein
MKVVVDGPKLFFKISFKIAGMSSIVQAMGLFSISTGMNCVWIVASIHLTPLSSYKNWFHFVAPFYVSLLLLIVWFALLTPLGCVFSLLFSTTSGIDWSVILLRSISVLMAVVHFLGSIFLTNAGLWFFFELAIEKATRKGNSSSPKLQTNVNELTPLIPNEKGDKTI